MNNLWSNKFIVRFSLVFFIHLLFIAGDESQAILEFSIRRIVFSLFFISYWLIIWYVAAYFYVWIQKKQSISTVNKSLYTYGLFFANFIFALIAAFANNLLYRFGDIHFFHKLANWSDVSIFNPELTMSLFSIYMMVFTADIFFTSSLKRKEDQIKMEKLKQENTLAQYLVLKSQIEPHFLFNSLSVLSSLIQTDIDVAEEFLLRLSKTLRYVIEKNELALVPLNDEIQFVENYFFLIKNRFEEGINFENTIDESIIQNSYIPPASLQLLIENAVKHNKFTGDDPLLIRLYAKEGFLIVKNNINLRDDVEVSTNRGIQNLTQRFSYFSDKAVNISVDEIDFTVAMPILTKADYERSNI
jgi:sensor histidine kinase YesM